MVIIMMMTSQRVGITDVLAAWNLVNNKNPKYAFISFQNASSYYQVSCDAVVLRVFVMARLFLNVHDIFNISQLPCLIYIFINMHF